ncbi:MAG: glutathione S-transferase N-terminal domain-containing protein [Alphaproteobacteria bacterium]
MKLYFSPTSPYVRKVRVMAEELGIDLDREPITTLQSLDDSSFGKVNPIHRLPALQLDDGNVLPDSKLICEYLNVLGGHKMVPAEGAARWHTLKLQTLADGILDAAVPRRAETARPPEQQSPTRLAQYVRSITQTLDALEAEAPAFVGVNLGTIAVACALGYLDFRFADEDWRATRPKLAAWYAEFAERPSMQASAPPA